MFYWIQVRQHTWPGLRHSCVILATCFGFILTLMILWNILLSSFWRVILSAIILLHAHAFMVPSINVISPTRFALMQPHIITLPPPCFTVETMHCSPGQVHTKHAGLHLSQTHVSWSHLIKQCAPHINQASFHVL